MYPLSLCVHVHVGVGVGNTGWTLMLGRGSGLCESPWTIKVRVTLEQTPVGSGENRHYISALGDGQWKTWNAITVVYSMPWTVGIQVLAPLLLPVSLWETS